MAPVMTTRNKPNNSSPWTYEANNRNNAWFGAGSAQHAMIGQQRYDAADTVAKLLITVGAGDGSTSLLAFKRGNTQLGRLYMNDDGGIMFGSTNSILGTNANAVGRLVSASGTGSTAFGSVAQATGENSVAVGSSVTAANTSSIAIGTSTTAGANNAIAIGNRAYTSGVNTLVIGNNASIENEYGRIPAREANKSDGSVVIGNATSLVYDGQTSKNVVVIGNGAKADAPLQLNGDGVIAIGENARAKQEGAIALGKDSEADGYYSSGSLTFANAMAIGQGAKAFSYRSIAIGNQASVSGNLGDSIALGTGAKVATGTTKDSSIAIGPNSKVESGYSIGIGTGVNTRRSSYTGYWGITTNTNETFKSGDKSISIGLYSYAKGNNSIAIGSLENFTSRTDYHPYSGGSSSIAIGTAAQSAGEKSVAIGYNAAANQPNAIAIGSGTRAFARNAVAIGNNIFNDKANVIQLGDSSSTVYIPGNMVVGKDVILGADSSNKASGNPYKVFLKAGNKDKNSSWVYLGTDDYKGGDDNFWRVNPAVVGPFSFSSDESFDAAADHADASTTTSDRRLKYVGKENTSGLDKIRQLKVFNYTFKKDTKKEPHVGVIAQDLQKVFPNAVKKGADGFLTIRMEDMFYAVINAIKELDSRMTALEKENKELKARLDRLEAKVK